MTWTANHFSILDALKLKWRKHRYWDATHKKLDLTGLVSDLKKAPKGSIVLFHGCAHNPTGMDPSLEEWKAIMKVVKVRVFLSYEVPCHSLLFVVF